MELLLHQNALHLIDEDEEMSYTELGKARIVPRSSPDLDHWRTNEQQKQYGRGRSEDKPPELTG